MGKLLVISATVALMGAVVASTAAQDTPMSFFISSVGSGNGADIGGLEGADARTWRAYLSTTGASSVNARDRIGSGPWYNAKGVMIASDVKALHADTANINPETGLDERGNPINSEGAPNRHDILTGSDVNGMATDMTCNNWTSSSDGSAMLGHYDRLSRGTPGSPWNEAHASRNCSQEGLVGTGGAGLLYCFATD